MVSWTKRAGRVASPYFSAEFLKSNEIANRGRINLSDEEEARFWTAKLGICREEIQHAIDKVGDTAVEVRLEIARNRNQ